MEKNSNSTTPDKKNRRNIAEQEKKVRRQRCKFYKVKSGALIFILVTSFCAGVGAKAAYDEVAPIVKVFAQNYSDNNTISGWLENYSVSKEGSFLDSEIKRENSDGWLVDGPLPYDYNDLDNLSINDEGKKVGALVDFYNGFDGYIENTTGTGYYKRIYEQMKRLESIGQNPNKIKCIYNYEELSKMFNKKDEIGKGIGSK